MSIRPRCLPVPALAWLLAALLACLMAACSGGGGSAGGPAPAPSPSPPPAASSGSLAVGIGGLPAGATAAVHLSGPNNFSRDLAQSTSLGELVPGSYTLSASLVAVGATGYAPTPLSQQANVVAGATTSASIAYAATSLALAAREVASAVDPVFLTAPPGDARQFVVERAGRIRILQNGSFLTPPFADLSARVQTAGEGGLLSMAFDPAYTSNGRFYLYYTDAGQNIVVERMQVSANPNLADPASSLVILRIAHPNFQNHYGGLLAFGADGYLYLGTGDGGSAGDPPRNAQNLNSLLGKLLRIDVSTASTAQPYAIPASNPYQNQAGRRGEIWAAGLRNPWRYTFDAGLLIIADVGQDHREEIDVAAASAGGLNYGWNIVEGSLCYNATSCELSGLTAPVLEYAHEGGACSITGGFVYRGAVLPELAGHYFYSDYCAGFLRSGIASSSSLGSQRDWGLAPIGNVLSFGRDGQGELYLLAGSGKIYRLERASP